MLLKLQDPPNKSSKIASATRKYGFAKSLQEHLVLPTPAKAPRPSKMRISLEFWPRRRAALTENVSKRMAPCHTDAGTMLMVTSAQTVAFSDRSQALALDPVLLHKRDRHFLPALGAHFISESYSSLMNVTLTSHMLVYPIPSKTRNPKPSTHITRPNARPGVSIKPTR